MNVDVVQHEGPAPVNWELDLARRVGEMSERLYAAGICPDCGGEIHHHIDEPFYTCQGCGACGEDTVGPGTIQKLRHLFYQTERDLTLINL